MELTGRQRAFLRKFLELYHQAQQPIHYTDVAKAFGVAKITAYDMLRLLERRGLVRFEYVLPGRGQGPGRSTVVSVPTSGAFDLFPELAGASWNWEEWETMKTFILENLSQRSEYQSLLEEILSHLPQRTTPLIYAAQMATAAILNLLLVEPEGSAGALMERLHELGLPNEVGLNALSGLTVGLSYVERANRPFADKLVAATRGYQQALARLSGEGKRHLSNFVREVMRAVAA